MFTKLYGGHGPVFERQLIESARDRFDLGVECLLLIPGDQKRCIHDHLVADRLVDARSDRDVPELVEHGRNVSL